ncbi:MAG TPA: urease accessory UreF family protein [Streptosporangiaceae bacterium]
MASDDPPTRKPTTRKPDWRAPDTGRGPETGEGPKVGRGPEVGERPDTGRGPETGRGPDTGKTPEVGTRPDTGESSKFGRGPEVGPCPDTGRGPEVGPRPDFGESPEVGESPDTSRIEEDRARLGAPPAAVLMLADARFPAGGHAHSGGLEGAVTAGTVSDVASLELFLRGRLATAGVVAAGLAAAACAQVTGDDGVTTVDAGAAGAAVSDGAAGGGGTNGGNSVAEGVGGAWGWLEAEADARTPSPAQREASRRQGRALLRAAKAAWPSPELAALGRAPHHAIVLGVAAATAGCSPAEAAQIAAYLSVTGPASAAVRLLALDPIEVSAAIARLAGAIEAAARRGARAAGPAGPGRELPYPSAPALDLYAEAHAQAEVRLFAS